MFDRLEDILIRYKEIEEELLNPGIVNDQKKYRDLMREQSNLSEIVEKYLEYKENKKTIEDSLEMLNEESDEEIRELAREELNECKKNSCD